MLHRQWGKEKSPNCPFCHFPPPLNFFPHQESAFSLDCVLQTLGKAVKGTLTRHTKKTKKINIQALGQALMGAFDTANILTKKKKSGAWPSVDRNFRHGTHSQKSST